MQAVFDPTFEFKYGFNPIKYVAEFLKWWHPSSAFQRKKDKIDACNILHGHTATAKIICGNNDENELKTASFKTG